MQIKTDFSSHKQWSIQDHVSYAAKFQLIYM